VVDAAQSHAKDGKAEEFREDPIFAKPQDWVTIKYHLKKLIHDFYVFCQMQLKTNNICFS